MNIILFITFSIPRVQKYAADIAIEKLKPKLGTEASIDGIRIRLFNTVELQGLYVEDQQQDTLLYADKLAVRLSFMDLFRNKVTLNKVGMENFVADVHRTDRDAPFSFQFIIDAFAKQDTVKVEKEKAPWLIRIDDLVLKNGQLRYDILSEPETPGLFNTDHLNVQNFDFRGKMEFLSVQDMRFNVKLMRLWEHSGFTINDFDGVVYAKNTLLTGDRIYLNLNNSDVLVTNAQFDTDSKLFSLTAKSETIDPKDATIFIKNFSHLDKPFAFEADLKGELPRVEVTGLKASYGSNTKVEISGLITDYNKFDESDLDINIKTVSVSQHDLQNLIRIAAPDYTSPPQLVALGNMDLQMTARGKLSNFTYQGGIKTEQGNVTLSGKGKADKKFNNLSLTGPVRTSNIQLANILGESAGLDDATLMADVAFNLRKGGAVTVTADGNVNSVLYKGYRYNNLIFDGTYSGTTVVANVKTESDLNKLDLFADVDFGAQKKFNVKGVVDRLDLRPFINRENWKMPSLTTRIDGDLAGNTFDDMVGTLVLDSTSLSDSSFIYNPGPIYLQALADEGAGKKLQIYSTFFEGEILGNYHFTTIGNELMYALHPHLPSVIKQPKRARGEFAKNDFQFNFLIKNTEDVSYAFSLPFYNVEPATITGTVNMANNEAISLNARIPRVMFGNNDIRETKIDINSGQLSGIGLGVNTYLVQDNGHINARLATNATSDSIVNNLFFDIQNKVTNANGQLNVSMGFLRDSEDKLLSNIRLHESTALFNGKNIYFNESTISHQKDRIEIKNFGVREENLLLLGIEGVASTNKNENVRVYFNNTEVENILSAFNIQNYKGSLKGNIYIHQALKDPIIQTENLRIEDISVYEDVIGTLQIEGDWNAVDKGLDLNAYLVNSGEQNIQVKGFLPTGDSSPRAMDVDVHIKEFKLASIQPLTTSIFSELEGSVNSAIRVTGKLSEPVMEGWLGIDKGVMKVAYTNVTYQVSDTIRVESTRVGTDNLEIRDNNGNLAKLSLSLSHSNFGRLVYNAHLRMDDFMLLNNEDRTDLMVYGLLKLTGDISLTGSPTGIFGDASLSSTSQSEVQIVLPQSAKAQEYSGVVYINTSQPGDSLAFLRKKDESLAFETTPSTTTKIPINIRGVIHMTPLLQVGATINPTTGDAIDVKGNGDLNILFNSLATPSLQLIGDYVIDEGDFKYSVVGLRKVDFDIRQGSSLTMIGDPLNTQFNIMAYKRVHADLGILHPSFRNELSNTRVPVDALLEVRGNLEAMNLTYNIELPEAANDIRQRVNSFISTDESRIRQFGNLVLLGNFYSAEGSPDLGIGTEMFTSMAANTLSRGLDLLFANVLHENWQVGTILESKDGTFDNARMGVDISGRLFNNRLRVTGNFTYGNNSMVATQQEFMSEFTAMWDINSWLMLRAYNHANDRFYRRAPYTQGVGAVITKEGETLYDLFRFNFRRKGGNEDE